jgi:hypothetical protein
LQMLEWPSGATASDRAIEEFGEAVAIPDRHHRELRTFKRIVMRSFGYRKPAALVCSVFQR